MKILSALLIMLTLSACPTLTKKESLKTNFDRNKQLYIQAASFMDSVGKNTSYTALDNSNGHIRLTNTGDEVRLLKKEEVPPAIAQLVLEENINIDKQNNNIYFQINGTKVHGLTKTSGILKTLTKDEPKIMFPWVTSYSVEPIENNWYTYRTNDDR
ncbi:hypothetical protein [Flagellimonas onchidii]|uniref:hypothetical protein n=1 Tax=Flagellimonas onchidii TaxID=2562684 RepID=UPI0010A6727C|nr:hypothetical protein [Allomuricauda onchidii]